MLIVATGSVSIIVPKPMATGRSPAARKSISAAGGAGSSVPSRNQYPVTSNQSPSPGGGCKHRRAEGEHRQLAAPVELGERLTPRKRPRPERVAPDGIQPRPGSEPSCLTDGGREPPGRPSPDHPQGRLDKGAHQRRAPLVGHLPAEHDREVGRDDCVGILAGAHRVREALAGDRPGVAEKPNGGRKPAASGFDPPTPLLGLGAPADVSLDEGCELELVVRDQRSELRMRRQLNVVAGPLQPDAQGDHRLHIAARTDGEQRHSHVSGPSPAAPPRCRTRGAAGAGGPVRGPGRYRRSERGGRAAQVYGHGPVATARSWRAQTTHGPPARALQTSPVGADRAPSERSTAPSSGPTVPPPRPGKRSSLRARECGR